ncbi:molecular chaperone DnaJ [Escherichia coli]|nr:molecular chaperone DnaJ [Escherichia coli]UKR64081.1 molecular chaperone DnaJ [Escherichia coli]
MAPVARDARTRSTAPRTAATHQDGVNSLTLALTAAFCGANQHNHGLLVCWALQGEGMACAPWYVRSLVFSFAPSMPCRASCKHNLTICI